MIRSMTGWGQSGASVNGAEAKVEIKSVNNRYFDCNVRIPRAFSSVEEGIKHLVGKRVLRGKVDVYVSLDLSKSAAATPKINRDTAKAYLSEMRALSAELGIPVGEVTAYELLRLPDVLSVSSGDEDAEDVTAAILSALSSALDSFNLSREREGSRLKDDIAARIDEIERVVGEIESRGPATVHEYRKRLEARLREVLEDRQVDETRLVTEVAIYADKVAVCEETVRLRSHLTEMRMTLTRDEPVGRRLDFLLQEANREANTIGAKVNDTEISQRVVDVKAEIEKIREQAQNIE